MAQIVNVCSYRLLKIKDVGGASLVTQASMINSHYFPNLKHVEYSTLGFVNSERVRSDDRQRVEMLPFSCQQTTSRPAQLFNSRVHGQISDFFECVRYSSHISLHKSW